MLRAMSCPWFYSENGSDYVAVGSTVTGNNISFRVVSLQNLDSSKGIYGRTYTQSIQAEATVKRVHLNRNWLLTGLFSSNRAVQIQPSVSLKKVWGFQNMCHSAIGMDHMLIHGQWVIFETLITPIYSRSLERKKVQAFCILQIFFSGIRTT